MSYVKLELSTSSWVRFSTRELDEIFQGYVDQELRNEIRTELRNRNEQSLTNY